MLERFQIENQSAQAIALALTAAFDKFCAPVVHWCTVRLQPDHDVWLKPETTPTQLTSSPWTYG